uniref:39S ribosomal protein L47, mitochondrial-like isoform X1 n=1 Tax=Ciona intestinalis TaxID=7719 RepID=UPI000180BC94|nr:39S ribosomal protein L47, mitochondrial-like isoform X1 [Ciona intestinalis]|eukprot:XP_026690876.1 39S ribosomal protein L47, mitochondrial-like isoform X1 [Ciona intestinalis]
MAVAKYCRCMLRISTEFISKPSFTSRSLLTERNLIPLITQPPKQIHTSNRQYGLEEFFDDPKNFGIREIKSGSSWSRDLLRLKSTEDLHKLWFVLLKERNMLQTLELYCKNEDEPMPGPDRLEKVAESMSNLRDVFDERESAKNMLLTGSTNKTPGEWRKSGLGITYWYEHKEHLLPPHLGKKKGDQHAEIAMFDRRLEEWHLRMEEKRAKRHGSYYYRIGLKWGRIRANNPNLPKKPPKWWMKKFKTTWKYGIHPEKPVLLPHHDDRFYWGKRPNKRY